MMGPELQRGGHPLPVHTSPAQVVILDPRRPDAARTMSAPFPGARTTSGGAARRYIQQNPQPSRHKPQHQSPRPAALLRHGVDTDVAPRRASRKFGAETSAGGEWCVRARATRFGHYGHRASAPSDSSRRRSRVALIRCPTGARRPARPTTSRSPKHIRRRDRTDATEARSPLNPTRMGSETSPSADAVAPFLPDMYRWRRE